MRECYIMTDTIRKPLAISAVALLLLCGALFAPAMASAVTIGGTVHTSAGLIAHPVTVDLWYWDGTDWLQSDFSTDTDNNGVWSIDVTSNQGVDHKAVFTDWPYYWYADTVYPDALLDASLVPSNGTTFTPSGGRTDLNATMAVLPKSYSGIVTDKTGKPLQGITVTAYDGANAWVGKTETGVNGAYELHGLTSGSYRLGFDDYNGAYAPTFYDNKTSLATAQLVPVGPAPTGTTGLATTMTRFIAVERVSPTSGQFWTQSANVARRQYVVDMSKPWSATTNDAAWDDVTDIVITSGDTRGQSDPLGAAGLCWAYQVSDPDSFNASFNAPLLLVSAYKTTDPSVLNLIKEIARSNTGLAGAPQKLTIHIVGGPVAVPEARFTEISKALTDAGLQAPAKDRLLSTGDRYDLAEKISKVMKSRADETLNDGLELANFAMIANGQNPPSFFDSLAFSPIAASVGAPILLVTKTSVPTQTTRAINALKLAGISGAEPVKSLYIGGGTAVVSSGVFNTLYAMRASTGSAQRLWGADRYETARAIADKAIAMSWLYDDQSVAIASTVTDAQLAGVLAGNEASPLLLTSPTWLMTTTSTWLTSKKGSLLRVYLVGSTSALTNNTYNSTKNVVAN